MAFYVVCVGLKFTPQTQTNVLLPARASRFLISLSDTNSLIRIREVNFKPSNLDVCGKGEGDMFEGYCWIGDLFMISTEIIIYLLSPNGRGYNGIPK